MAGKPHYGIAKTKRGIALHPDLWALIATRPRPTGKGDNWVVEQTLNAAFGFDPHSSKVHGDARKSGVTDDIELED